VDFRARCRGDRFADLTSNVFAATRLRDEGGVLHGIARVGDRAGFGTGWVHVRCSGGYEYDTDFRVRPDRDHESYLDLDPSSGHRGDEIDITAGCDRRIGRVTSDALNDVDLDRDGRPWRFSATTKVSSDAEPGDHDVNVDCGGETLTETFFVTDDGDDDDGDGKDSDGKDSDGKDSDGKDSDGGDQTKVFPKGAPDTGGGPVSPLAAVLAQVSSPVPGSLTAAVAPVRAPR
jgi:hypothetical protein